jgi:hypothetical protein
VALPRHELLQATPHHQFSLYLLTENSIYIANKVMAEFYESDEFCPKSPGLEPVRPRLVGHCCNDLAVPFPQLWLPQDIYGVPGVR